MPPKNKDMHGGAPEIPSDMDATSDVSEIKRAIENALTDMNLAVDAAGLHTEHPTRFMLRIYAASVRYTAALICKLADQITAASSDLRREREELALRNHAAARAHANSLRAYVTVATVSIVAGVVISVAIVKGAEQSEAPLTIDFGGPGVGRIECGNAARDADGDYHCSMRIVLKGRRKNL